MPSKRVKHPYHPQRIGRSRVHVRHQIRHHLIEGSTLLGFTDDYQSLTGGGAYQDLKKVAVGKKSAADALGILASYKHGPLRKKR